MALYVNMSRGNDTCNKNHLMQLAMSLALDLRLNKPLIDEGGHKFARMVACGLGAPSEVHTLEQRRAVLGCFFLSSWFAFPLALLLFEPPADIEQDFDFSWTNRSLAMDSAG